MRPKTVLYNSCCPLIMQHRQQYSGQFSLWRTRKHVNTLLSVTYQPVHPEPLTMSYAGRWMVCQPTTGTAGH